MKLFDDFEAVKFPEENLIFITHSGYLYYIYNQDRKYWRRNRDAGNQHITVENYPDVTESELKEAMNGDLPKNENDFVRLCPVSDLSIGNMLALLEEDYAKYASEHKVWDVVSSFLFGSTIPHKSYEKIRLLLDKAVEQSKDTKWVIEELKALCFKVIGRDIFKKEIGIVDGHNGSSYFWIMPVRVIDDSDTNQLENVAEMARAEISIEEDDVASYLTPFLFKHFDEELDANRKRVESYWIDDDGTEQKIVVEGFEWYLTHNFFTFDSVNAILNDIGDTVEAIERGEDTEITLKLGINREVETDTDDSEEDFCRITDPKLIIDFYRRFTYRMEYMMTVGKENGFDLISFMGP